MEMNPSTKGSIAEAAITADAVKAGVQVLRPVIEGSRYDLVLDLAGRFVRVQCKWATRQGAVISASIRTSRLTPGGYVRTTYDASEVDAFGLYCAELDECYLIPLRDVEGQSKVQLRLTLAANGQELAIRYAETYRLNGAIAQLGERLAGSQKVGGSSPPGSTPREAA
jgi:PD-(D/E)XK nuclease superfamily protein